MLVCENCGRKILKVRLPLENQLSLGLTKYIIKQKIKDLVKEKKRLLKERKYFKNIVSSDEYKRSEEYANYFIFYDIESNELRNNIRILHLASSFLHGIPYKCVEKNTNKFNRPTPIQLIYKTKYLTGEIITGERINSLVIEEWFNK